MAAGKGNWHTQAGSRNLLGVAGDITGTIASAAVVAAVVGAGSSFLTQRYLLNRKAQLDYESLARKRLSEAVGPLRMQLLFAARDLGRRVKPHSATMWNMDPAGDYVRSWIYRLLRPLAVAQLIERQMGIADFAVDPAAIALLQFNTTAERMLSGASVLLDHPDVDWSTQSQHLFRDNLRAAAARLIVESDDSARVMDYLTFHNQIQNPVNEPSLAALSRIFQRSETNLTRNPIFWLRIVAYGYTCNKLIATHGVSVGFEALPFPTRDLLLRTDDEWLTVRATEYERQIEAITKEGL